LIQSNFHLALLALSVAALGGCAAHSAPPLRVRYAELARPPELRPGQAIIVELDPGDRIPIDLRFSDDAFDLTPSPPKLELVARRRCFIQVGPTRLKTSLTGADFERAPRAPGRFHVGLRLGRASRLIVEVTTPRHPDSP